MTIEQQAKDAAKALVEREETMVEKIAEGEVDSTDSSLRYAAYLARLRPLLLPATRYLAYTSDVGEAFRPVVNSKVVTGAYGISWAYVLGDVAYEGYKGRLDWQARQEAAVATDDLPSPTTEVGLRVAKRAIFQSTASMCVAPNVCLIRCRLGPALTIHSVVRYSKPLFKNMSLRMRGVGPTVLGLATIPALPYIFDEPVEHALDRVWPSVESVFLKPGQKLSELHKKEL